MARYKGRKLMREKLKKKERRIEAGSIEQRWRKFRHDREREDTPSTKKPGRRGEVESVKGRSPECCRKSETRRERNAQTIRTFLLSGGVNK